MRSYPTREGIAVPTREVDLPASRLNLKNEKNFNNHHLEFSKRMFSQALLLSTLRDLDSMQEMLPLDVHNQGKRTLHTLYSPPALPTPEQAMSRVADAYDIGEHLHVWNSMTHEYEIKPITRVLYEAIKRNYEEVR